LGGHLRSTGSLRNQARRPAFYGKWANTRLGNANTSTRKRNRLKDGTRNPTNLETGTFVSEPGNLDNFSCGQKISQNRGVPGPRTLHLAAAERDRRAALKPPTRPANPHAGHEIFGKKKNARPLRFTIVAPRTAYGKTAEAGPLGHSARVRRSSTALALRRHGERYAGTQALVFFWSLRWSDDIVSIIASDTVWHVWGNTL
jgi:hypothetical protein